MEKEMHAFAQENAGLKVEIADMKRLASTQTLDGNTTFFSNHTTTACGHHHRACYDREENKTRKHFSMINKRKINF